MENVTGYITRSTYTTKNGNVKVVLYGRLTDGRSFKATTAFQPYFYVETDDEERVKDHTSYPLHKTDLTTLQGDAVSKVVTHEPSDVKDIRKELLEAEIPVYEADVRFTQRYLIDNDIFRTINIEGEPISGERVDVVFEDADITPAEHQPSPGDLVVLSVDIETSPDHEELYSISAATFTETTNFILHKEAVENAETFTEEKELLNAFRDHIIDVDPDIITGWNVIDFDLERLKERFEANNVRFDIGRQPGTTSLRLYSEYLRDSTAKVPGRVVVDGIHALQNNFIKLPDYKLGTAAKKYGFDGKDFEGPDKVEQIQKAYTEDPERLVDYNAHDAEVVLDILMDSNAYPVLLYRTFITGMSLDRVQGSIASFDSLYLRRLRERGKVAPIVNYRRTQRTTGGYVMESKPGIYNYVVVCDFKSLYPSIIQTFNIDPLTYEEGLRDGEDVIEAPNGAKFTRTPGVLPEILAELLDERAVATQNEESVKRYAIKILMNSMYGVLASPNCRFYSFEMANAITSFGHEILKETRSVLEEDGYEIIYGDTDSIFVDLKTSTMQEAQSTGEQLIKQVNSYLANAFEEQYGVKSKIILEFEKIYKKFFTPPTRGDHQGAKKRYAGLVEKNGDEDIEFTGLEYVRRDWTDLSKQFQYELLWKVFHDEPVDQYVREYVERLRNGEFDEEIVYRKGLSKPVEEYTSTTPPHVKAAKKQDEVTSNVVEYVVTVDGPEPVSDVRHSINYEHYVEKQLEPVAESILYVLGKEFNDVLKGTEQLDLSQF